MTEQHDAPSKLKDTNLMRVQIQDALRFWHDKIGYPAAQEGEIHIGADIVLAAISTQAAPSGLVDAVRAFLAAQDAWDAFTVEHDDEGHRHHTLEWNRLGAALTAARATLDTTLSGQQGGAVPVGDLYEALHIDALLSEWFGSLAAEGIDRRLIDGLRNVLRSRLTRARLAAQPAPATQATTQDGEAGR